MVRIILRHVSGSRAPAVDVISLGLDQELLLGRVPSAAIRFDPAVETAVAPRHARIIQATDYEEKFILVDLGSGNGTFLNGEPVHLAVFVRTGDLIQLGSGGPVLEFRVEREERQPR
jgi:pSer/pThr/pTyr-binding forkhead associated (FHA) protein